MGAQMEQMQQENQQLQSDNSAEQAKAQTDQMNAQTNMLKVQSEAEYKREELELRKTEAAAKTLEPKPTPQEQWQYDQMESQMKRDFEAEQNALDRQADLAKTIISKTDTGEGMEDDGDLAANVFAEAAAILAAPKRVIRDPVTNEVVGVETVM